MGEDGARGKDWIRARGHHLSYRHNFLVRDKSLNDRTMDLTTLCDIAHLVILCTGMSSPS